jgi:hypothetical protein
MEKNNCLKQRENEESKKLAENQKKEKYVPDAEAELESKAQKNTIESSPFVFEAIFNGRVQLIDFEKDLFSLESNGNVLHSLFCEYLGRNWRFSKSFLQTKST